MNASIPFSPLSPEQAVELVMSDFDFKRVRKVMKATSWTWALDPGDPQSMAEVPKKRWIKEVARRLLSEVALLDLSEAATGGLVARMDVARGTLSLAFEVTSAMVDLSTGDTY